MLRNYPNENRRTRHDEPGILHFGPYLKDSTRNGSPRNVLVMNSEEST